MLQALLMPTNVEISVDDHITTQSLADHSTLPAYTSFYRSDLNDHSVSKEKHKLKIFTI